MKYTKFIVYGDFFNLDFLNTDKKYLMFASDITKVIVTFAGFASMTCLIPAALLGDSYRSAKYHMIVYNRNFVHFKIPQTKFLEKDIPDRFYIGSAKDIKNRWREHRFQLKNNKHHAKKLQRHYNKHGSEDLLYILIENCLPEFLIKKEQYYINELKPYFNSNPIAGSRLGTKHDETTLSKMRKPRSEMGRENIKKGNKFLGTHPSKETLEKLSKLRLGKPKSEEWKIKMRKPKPPGFGELIKNSWIKRKEHF